MSAEGPGNTDGKRRDVAGEDGLYEASEPVGTVNDAVGQTTEDCVVDGIKDLRVTVETGGRRATVEGALHCGGDRVNVDRTVAKGGVHCATTEGNVHCAGAEGNVHCAGAEGNVHCAVTKGNNYCVGAEGSVRHEDTEGNNAGADVRRADVRSREREPYGALSLNAREINVYYSWGPDARGEASRRSGRAAPCGSVRSNGISSSSSSAPSGTASPSGSSSDLSRSCRDLSRKMRRMRMGAVERAGSGTGLPRRHERGTFYFLIHFPFFLHGMYVLFINLLSFIHRWLRPQRHGF